MKYSIVMPVYKRFEILRFTIESISSQSYKPSELIIVDNNIKEEDISLLKDYVDSIREKLNFKVIYAKSPKNSGAQARNLGAKLVSTQLVAFLDSDVLLDDNYYEKLVKYFSKDEKIIAAQGVDRSLLVKRNFKNLQKLFHQMIYLFEQFFETSVLFNKQHPYVSPSLAVAHPNLENDFELYTEWISTCAGIFRKSLFNKYSFPDQFITYSNNEYLMFSYNLYKNSEGKMIYTSKAKYKDIQTYEGRISRINLMYQIETYDLYIFINLFDLNLKNLFIFLKSRLGHLFYYIMRLLLKKNLSTKLYLHSVISIFYPLLHIKSILKNDLSFFENDFPIE